MTTLLGSSCITRSKPWRKADSEFSSAPEEPFEPLVTNLPSPVIYAPHIAPPFIPQHVLKDSDASSCQKEEGLFLQFTFGLAYKGDLWLNSLRIPISQVSTFGLRSHHLHYTALRCIMHELLMTRFCFMFVVLAAPACSSLAGLGAIMHLETASCRIPTQRDMNLRLLSFPPSPVLSRVWQGYLTQPFFHGCIPRYCSHPAR